MQFAAGDRVAVRGHRYVVDEAVTFTDCTLLSLSSADPIQAERSCKVLLPFDRPVKSAEVGAVRVCKPRRWMRHLHATVSDLRRFGQLRSAVRASIDILPFQLEPALALVSGRASRFLLADEVGLGKTIQAGLMMVELQERGWCERALIVTPAGLRRQWADELHRRFGLQSAIVDAASLSARSMALPREVNPWMTEPIFITSIDFIKQPEVLRGLSGLLWDIVIVDEAHLASGGSLRYEAVNMVAARSRYVVLLTATPHAGDEAQYRALCDVGGIASTAPKSDRILLFRRTRQQAGLPRTRRVHLLSVRPSADELEMHRLLADYVARLWRIAHANGRHDLQLVAMVLNKRAFSSARSLAASIERRLSAISGSLPAEIQWNLPFAADIDSADDAPYLNAPAFDRSDEEEATLRQLLDASRRAQHDERKIHTIQKLLRRVKEPIIVFTEYRDTLQALHSLVGNGRKTTLLHGGLTPQDRRSAVDAFTRGAADLLLATDAGAEGLNLQNRCRVVVNLELPWNPTRLEQRIGRVDRIGQQQTVHAINLFADCTAESDVLARLLRRLDRIYASEIEIAASVINRNPLPPRLGVSTPDGITETADLKSAAEAEAMRIAAARCVTRTRLPLNDGVIPVTCVRLKRAKPSIIWFIRVKIANQSGRLIEDRLTPIATLGPSLAEVHRAKADHGPAKADHGLAEAGHYVLRRRDLRSIAEGVVDLFGPTVLEFASQLAKERADAISQELNQWLPSAAWRENDLVRMATTSPPVLIQAGLFDNRSMKDEQRAAAQRLDILNASAERKTLLEASARAVPANKPEIVLLLIARC